MSLRRIYFASLAFAVSSPVLLGTETANIGAQASTSKLENDASKTPKKTSGKETEQSTVSHAQSSHKHNSADKTDKQDHSIGIGQLADEFLRGKIKISQLEKDLSEKKFVLVAMASAEKLASHEINFDDYKPGSVLQLLEAASGKRRGLEQVARIKGFSLTQPSDSDTFFSLFIAPTVLSSISFALIADDKEKKGVTPWRVFSSFAIPFAMYQIIQSISKTITVGAIPTKNGLMSLSDREALKAVNVVELLPKHLAGNGNSLLEKNAESLFTQLSASDVRGKEVYYLERGGDNRELSLALAQIGSSAMIYKPRGIKDLTKFSDGARRFIALRNMIFHKIISTEMHVIFYGILPGLVLLTYKLSSDDIIGKEAAHIIGAITGLALSLLPFSIAADMSVPRALSRLKKEGILTKEVLVDIERIEILSNYRDFFPASGVLKFLSGLNPLRTNLSMSLKKAAKKLV